MVMAQWTSMQKPSCDGHLRRYGSFALQFRLVPLEGLLPAVFEFVAIVVFWEAVCAAEFCTTVRTLSDDAEDC